MTRENDKKPSITVIYGKKSYDIRRGIFGKYTRTGEEGIIYKHDGKHIPVWKMKILPERQISTLQWRVTHSITKLLVTKIIFPLKYL